jgi:hypothetical protein
VATISLTRPDVFPNGTVVGIYPAQSWRTGQNPQGPPTAAVIATGTVSGDNLSVTNAGILSYQSYVAAAQVGGVWQGLRCRSTLDVADIGTATGTGNTTSGSATLSSVAATQGAFAIGQRVTGPGIPAGSFLIDNPGAGSTWTMSDKATATATGIALVAYGASPASVPSDQGVGAKAVPVPTSTWRAKVAQRRNLSGTS